MCKSHDLVQCEWRYEIQQGLFDCRLCELIGKQNSINSYTLVQWYCCHPCNWTLSDSMCKEGCDKITWQSLAYPVQSILICEVIYHTHHMGLRGKIATWGGERREGGRRGERRGGGERKGGGRREREKVGKKREVEGKSEGEGFTLAISSCNTSSSCSWAAWGDKHSCSGHHIQPPTLH